MTINKLKNEVGVFRKNDVGVFRKNLTKEISTSIIYIG